MTKLFEISLYCYSNTFDSVPLPLLNVNVKVAQNVTQHELDRYTTFTFTLGNGNGTESKVLLYIFLEST